VSDVDPYEIQAEQIAEGSSALDRLAPRCMFTNPIQSVVYDGRFIHLKVTPTSSQRSSYTVPGQYVVARFSDGKPRFIALYGSPNEEVWEFLFEPKPEWELSQFAPGFSIATSMAEGHGYPMSFSGYRDVAIFVGGSGIAGILPWLSSQPRVENINVFFALGEEAPSTVLRTELAAREVGADLSLIDPSQMKAAAERFPPHPVGYGVLLCGSPRMMKDVAHVLLSRGFHRDQIFTNLS
jgi:ferredoxin-NADP reductase